MLFQKFVLRHSSLGHRQPAVRRASLWTRELSPDQARLAGPLAATVPRLQK